MECVSETNVQNVDHMESRIKCADFLTIIDLQNKWP